LRSDIDTFLAQMRAPRNDDHALTCSRRIGAPAF
jgi:hypothetical protein